jgi:hypothetical protein
MDEWTGIAFGAFTLSSFVSALQIGLWILHAEPRAIINAGHWSLVLIALLLSALLLWLMASGRWTNAMLLAAFFLPILVQALPRWRLLLRPIDFSGVSSFTFAPDRRDHREYPSRPNGPIDPKLVRNAPLFWRLTSKRRGAKSSMDRTGKISRTDQQMGLPKALPAGRCRSTRRSISWGSKPQRPPMRSVKRTGSSKKNSTSCLGKINTSLRKLTKRGTPSWGSEFNVKHGGINGGERLVVGTDRI